MTPASEPFAAFEHWPRWASRLLFWGLIAMALIGSIQPPPPAAAQVVHFIFQPVPMEAAARSTTDLTTTP